VDEHFWVVLSDPLKDSAKVVIVNFTSDSADKDQACIVNVGDHPWVSKKTCVNYPEARFLSVEDFWKLKKAGLIQSQEPASPQLLERMQRAVADSLDVPIEIEDLLAEQGLVCY